MGFCDSVKPSMKLGPSGIVLGPGALSSVAEAKRERDMNCMSTGRIHPGSLILQNTTKKRLMNKRVEEIVKRYMD